jgi:hypothetical protein
VGEQPQWNLYGQRESDQWQGRQPYPQQQPYGQQQPLPDRMPYQGTVSEPPPLTGEQDTRAWQTMGALSGRDPRAESVPAPHTHRARPAKVRTNFTPKRMLFGAGVLVVIIGGIGAGLAFTAGPSYAQPWCASTLNYMYTSTPTGTFQDYLNELQYEENQGAPTGQLLSDEEQLSQDAANAQSDPVSEALEDLAAESSDMAAVKADAEAINRACGLPATWNIGKLGVPSGA